MGVIVPFIFFTIIVLAMVSACHEVVNCITLSAKCWVAISIFGSCIPWIKRIKCSLKVFESYSGWKSFLGGIVVLWG